MWPEELREFRKLLPALSDTNLARLRKLMESGKPFDAIGVARQMIRSEAKAVTKAVPAVPSHLTAFFDHAGEYGRSIHLGLDPEAHADLRREMIKKAERSKRLHDEAPSAGARLDDTALATIFRSEPVSRRRTSTRRNRR